MSDESNIVPEQVADGLHQKYRVEKVGDPTGRHSQCRYFVLDPAHDPIAIAAIVCYAEVARYEGSTALADDLDAWIESLPSGGGDS